jgi:hypothetical protein
MKKMILMISVITILSMPQGLFAASNTIAIVYSNTNSTTRHAVQFIAEESRRSGLPYDFAALKVNDRINPADYKAVIILNAGKKSGIDRNLQSFINGVADKRGLVLVTLRKGSRDYAVSRVGAAENDLELDAVTAASRWGNKALLRMHREWVKTVFSLIR